MAKGYIEKMLGDREKILLITRQHWFVLLQAIIVELIVIVALIIAAVLINIFLPGFGLIPALIILALELVPILGGLRDFMIWYNRDYIVTNHRVIQISGVFNKDVIDSNLEKVNDIKMSQSVFGRLFNFGDVEILTASEEGVNLFRRIGDPIRFKTVMLNAKETLEHGSGTPAPGPNGPADIPTMISELDQLRKQGVLSEAEFQQKKTELLKKMN